MNYELEKIRYMKEKLVTLEATISKLKRDDLEKAEKEQCISVMEDFVRLMIQETDDRLREADSLHGQTYERRRENMRKEFVMKDTRALIVDDNEINDYIVREMLKQFHVEADVALSGEQAVELYSNNQYDLVFMDYQMPPGIDGCETVRRIRRMGERGKNQLIIGLTANTVEDFKAGLNEQNVELILFKPVKMDQIALILQKELANKIDREK